MPQDMDIYQALLQRLVTGVYENNTKLRPEYLRKDFECSASTIREALFRLSTVGLVYFQEQRGFRVPKASVERHHELTQMRILYQGR